MVELFNAFVVDLTDPFFTNEAAVTVRNSSLSAREDRLWITHKRVDIELEILESDNPNRATTTISLSPVMALALVRRLIDCLDGSGLENLPPVHSRFTRLLIDHLNGVKIDDDVLRQIALIDAASSTVDEDEESLEDILPPSLR